jgi:hypothetical protein
MKIWGKSLTANTPIFRGEMDILPPRIGSEEVTAENGCFTLD